MTAASGTKRLTVRVALVIALSVSAVVGTALPARAEAAGHLPGVVLPQVACEDLAGRRIPGLPGEPARLLSAVVVPAADARSEYCLVSGYISPQHLFEMRLPTTNWTQRYLQTGCGGFCGAPPSPQEAALHGCERYAGGELAVAYGNAGHVSAGALDASWAVDRALLEDYAYESEHQLSVVAKRVLGEFYGRGPRYSYFMGCSNGGRQALVLTERYPDDFDGVVAGAPANITVPLVVFSLGWNARANTAPDGSQILTPDDLPVLHEGALEACDAADGLADGVITDPRRCDFDPGVLACPAAAPEEEGCLTEEQVEAARKIYAGATDEQGRRLYPGGMPVGSELAWVPWIVRSDPATSGLSEAFGSGWLRYLSSFNPTVSRDLATQEFDAAAFEELTEMDAIFAAIDPDLSAFRQSGGKLLLWHGWNDPAIPAEGVIAYYEAVEEHLGADAVEDFVRLYLVPGMYHCSGGDGPDEFNMLGPVMAWVERGVAPYRIVAAETDEGTVVRTRPLFPYPEEAVFTGTGDPDDERNWVAQPGVDHPEIEWAGEFRSGYQRWCHMEGNRLVCGPQRAASP